MNGDGWYVEGPDPSVGIFGDLIVHEECEVMMIDDQEAPSNVNNGVTSDFDYASVEKEGVVTVTTRYTCICGATLDCFESYPADHFEEPREEYR